MKKTAVLMIIIPIILIKTGTCQFPDWKYGFQVKGGITKFNFDDLITWLDENFSFPKGGEWGKPGEISSGPIWDVSFFLRPNKYVSIVFGFVPVYKAKKKYTIDFP